MSGNIHCVDHLIVLLHDGKRIFFTHNETRNIITKLEAVLDHMTAKSVKIAIIVLIHLPSSPPLSYIALLPFYISEKRKKHE